jgi:exosortase
MHGNVSGERAVPVVAPATVWTSVSLWVWLVLAALLLLYGSTFAWLWDRWTMSVWHNAHGMLIPPLVGYFIYEELKRFDGPAPRGSVWGFALLVPGLLLHVVDVAMHTQLLSAASIVVALPGLSLLFLGPERTRAILFPLLFLAFMLPIPLGVTERLHLALRHVAAWGSEILVPLVGVPLYREGLTLHTANAQLLVADACSGFSTLYAAMAVACLTAYFCPVPWRRVAVLLAAAPLAIGANILRVALLVLLVRWQGSDVLATSLHTISGIFTFALALPLIFWIGSPPPPPRPATPTPQAP